jgi:hypothetical protein
MYLDEKTPGVHVSAILRKSRQSKSYFEKLVPMYQTTRRDIPRNSNLNTDLVYDSIYQWTINSDSKSARAYPNEDVR